MSKGTGTKPGLLAKAVAAELRGELARQGKSLRSLDGVLSSKGYVQARLSVHPTQSLDFTDIEAVCDFLGVDVEVIWSRARQSLRTAE